MASSADSRREGEGEELARAGAHGVDEQLLVGALRVDHDSGLAERAQALDGVQSIARIAVHADKNHVEALVGEPVRIANRGQIAGHGADRTGLRSGEHSGNGLALLAVGIDDSNRDPG